MATNPISVTPISMQSGSFDSNAGNQTGTPGGSPVNISDTVNWTRVMTLITNRVLIKLPIHIEIGAGGGVNFRLTGTSKQGEGHIVYLTGTDFNTATSYLRMVLNGAGGSISAGTIAAVDFDISSVAEVGIECQAQSTATTARCYGTTSLGNKLFQDNPSGRIAAIST